MKLSTALLVSVCLLLSYTSYAQKFDWLKKVGDAGDDCPGYMMNDTMGNLYVTGNFVGTVILGSDTLHSPDIFTPAPFLVKFDSNGNALWARVIPIISGSTAGGCGAPLKVKLSRYGRVYVIGDILYVGNYYQYLAIYRQNGSLITSTYSFSARGSYTDIAFDSLDNVYLCGSPHAKASSGFFITKYDSSLSIKWKYTSSENNSASNVFVNKTNVYVSGDYYGQIHLSDTMGSSTITLNATSFTSTDFFQAKYTLSGQLIGGYTSPGTYYYGSTFPDYTSGYTPSGNWEVAFTTVELSSINYANIKKYDLGFSSIATVTKLEAGCVLAPGSYMKNSTFKDEGMLTEAGLACASRTVYKYDASSVVTSDTVLFAGTSHYVPVPDFSFDKTSSTYITSGFQGSISYYDGTGLHTVSSTSGTEDIYIGKYHRCKVYNPSVVKSHDTLFCSDTTAGLSYSWKFNGNPISGANKKWYIPHSTGQYGVSVSDIWKCTSISTNLYVTVEVQSITAQSDFQIYPNPASENIIVSFNDKSVRTIEIDNMFGQCIVLLSSQSNEEHISVSNLTSGIYILKVRTRTETAFRKFTKL